MTNKAQKYFDRIMVIVEEAYTYCTEPQEFSDFGQDLIDEINDRISALPEDEQ